MEENLNPEEVISSDVDKTAGKNLAELSEMFQSLNNSEDAMLRYKEADAIKSAFYKLLNHLKEETVSAGQDVGETMAEVEESFKTLYAEYKRKRAEYNRAQDELKAKNLEKKQAVIEDLKALIESQEEVNFDAFRAIQDRWREIGPVPATNFRDINDTYHLYVEKFYDIVKINRDLRDLDFKKNLEAKEAFCAAAEKLSDNEDIVKAFAELQKLHEQWKEFGPVAKEFRDDIWNRFKAATAIINKKYQAHFEDLKAQMEQNLQAKTSLCEQVEEIAGAEAGNSGEWNSLSHKIEELQTQWRTIGFATKKENQKIYERFRAACDKFFERKRAYYNEFKASMEANVIRKQAIIERMRTLKDSTEWKKATDEIISLQKEWKEIGAVPRKLSETLWSEFRGLCDQFFAEREKNASSAKDSKSSKFSKAAPGGRRQDPDRRVQSSRNSLMSKYKALQQDIVTYENNIGFFSASKNAAPLIKQMQDRIDAAKAELKELEAEIRKSQEEA